MINCPPRRKSHNLRFSPRLLLRGAAWTIGAYGIGQVFRFTSNVVLTHLLAPELFGLIAVVYSITTGIHLLSDVGIGQNLVYESDARHPDFYNTAWTIQLLRGAFLWLVTVTIAFPLSRFYQMPTFAYVLPAISLSFILVGLSSTGRYFAQKDIRFVRLNIFEVIMDFVSSAANVVAAILNPTIWAFVFGSIFTQCVRTIGTYFLVSGLRHRFFISKDHAISIFHFSKWIFLSSIAFFMAANFDTLFLGKVSSFALLGVYGIARMLSQQLVTVASRLSATFVLPIFSSAKEWDRRELRNEVAFVRGTFLAATAAGLSLIAVGADLLVSAIYDVRYQAAGWMLPILITGSWFSILCSVNESALLGLGKPNYSAIGNFSKFGWLLIAAPICYSHFGVLGFVIVVAMSDLVRYVPSAVGLRLQGLSFGLQDGLITIVSVAMVTLWETARWSIGLGFSPM